MQGWCDTCGFGSSAEAERCDASAASSAVTVNQHLVFLENSQGVHRRMASRQGGHASPWCDRKGLCRAVQGRRRHAERNRFRTKANRCCAPAESASTNRDASCASVCAAKAGPHHDCGTRARPSAAVWAALGRRDGARAQRQGNAGGGGSLLTKVAKAQCPSDTVVWVNLPSKVYHFAGTRSYGTTKRGAYMCEKEAIAAEDRASKTEKHP